VLLLFIIIIIIIIILLPSDTPLYIASARTAQKTPLKKSYSIVACVCWGDNVTATDPLPSNGRVCRAVP
jgi:hypothetical protein